MAIHEKFVSGTSGEAAITENGKKGEKTKRMNVLCALIFLWVRALQRVFHSFWSLVWDCTRLSFFFLIQFYFLFFSVSVWFMTKYACNLFAMKNRYICNHICSTIVFDAFGIYCLGYFVMGCFSIGCFFSSEIIVNIDRSHAHIQYICSWQVNLFWFLSRK